MKEASELVNAAMLSDSEPRPDAAEHVVVLSRAEDDVEDSLGFPSRVRDGFAMMMFGIYLQTKVLLIEWRPVFDWNIKSRNVMVCTVNEGEP